MAIVTKAVSVSTTPTKLNQVDADGVYGCSIVVRNQGQSSVFLGGSTVSVVNGFELPAGEEFSADLKGSDDLYAIASTGSISVSVLQAGV